MRVRSTNPGRPLRLAAAVGGVSVLVTLVACSGPSEGRTVQIPTFSDVPGVSYEPTVPPSSPEWTPTWDATLPTVAPAIKPTATPPKTPKPPPLPPPTPTKDKPPPGITIPELPGVPFVRAGGRCAPEGAVGITRSGQPMVCTKAGRGDALRWRSP